MRNCREIFDKEFRFSLFRVLFIIYDRCTLLYRNWAMWDELNSKKRIAAAERTELKNRQKERKLVEWRLGTSDVGCTLKIHRVGAFYR